MNENYPHIIVLKIQKAIFNFKQNFLDICRNIALTNITTLPPLPPCDK